MKYIRTEILGIILFSETHSHKDMADRLMSPNDHLISAGFVNADDWINDGKVSCHGESMTLGLRSHKDDTETLRCMLRR